MRNLNKYMLTIPILITMLSLVGGLSWVSATDQPQQVTNNASDSEINTSSTRYLPVLTKNYCTPRPADSPFSVEIAALHQISPASGLDQAGYEEQLAWDAQTLPTLLSAIKETCVGWTRVVINWTEIEPTESGGYVKLDWYDNRLGQITKAGINIIAVINSAPEWANQEGTYPCPPIDNSHLTNYKNFLTFIVDRYSKAPFNINHWEIFNEADNTTTTEGFSNSHACFGDYHKGGPALYAQVLADSNLVIKTIDPKATVLMSGIAHERWFEEYPYPDNIFYRYFPDDVMVALKALSGGTDNFDALNFHYFENYYKEWEQWLPPNTPTCSRPPGNGDTPYDVSGYDIMAKKNFFTNRMNMCYNVNKPVYLTELAAHGYPDDEGSLRFQAYYVIQGYTRGLAAGIKNISWYAIVSPPTDTNEQGLLYKDTYQPKPAFFAYKTLINQLTGYHYTRTIMSTKDGDNGSDSQNYLYNEAYVFQNSAGKEKIVAWGNNYSLDIPANSLRLTDFYGNVTMVVDGGTSDGDGSQNGMIKILLPLDLMKGSTRIFVPTPIPLFIEVTSP